MKYHDIAAHGVGAGQLQPEKMNGQFIGFRFDGVGQIDDIGSMNNELIDAIFFHQCVGSVNVQLTDLFPAGILGRAGVNHKGICPVRESFFHRAEHHFFPAHAHMGTEF